MKLRLSLTPQILGPVALTFLVVVALAMFLSGTSNIATLGQTVSARQDELIRVLTDQFSGGVKFGKMETVEAAFTAYRQDPGFGLVAAGAVDAQGKSTLSVGDDKALAAQGIALAATAVATSAAASVLAGSFHIAAVPALFGKDHALVGAVTMTWDLSAYRNQVIAQQLRNGLIALGLALAAMAGLGLFLMRRVTVPLRELAAVADRLAHADFDVTLRGAGRRDELGDLVRAVEVFRANGLRMAEMTTAEAAAIIRSQAERAKMMAELQAAFGNVVDAAIQGDFSRRVNASFSDAELNALAGGVNTLVETVDRGIAATGDVLGALAKADLTRRVEGDFGGALGRLRDDTNLVADQLSEVVTRLRGTSRSLRSATGEILAGANDLSMRTTKQAATIEETSAAMEQIATTVLDNAKRADEASGIATAVTGAAEHSGQVMRDANVAMARITTSSGKISNITGLIDDIAFQTNLLALNASVEAARAGDAGKGFAVVAVEVRRLAQSAAEASKEIKVLVEASGLEVASGSRLVAEAATQLDAMLVSMRQNNALMDTIAQDNREQSSSIEQINVAVRQMDEMTQHNAALVEETNAAIEQTENQAVELDNIVDVFVLADSQRARPAARASAPSATYRSHGNVAVKADWEEM